MLILTRVYTVSGQRIVYRIIMSWSNGPTANAVPNEQVAVHRRNIVAMEMIMATIMGTTMAGITEGTTGETTIDIKTRSI
jgi:hypothetical protein